MRPQLRHRRGPAADCWFLGPDLFEGAQSLGELRSFLVEPGQPILYSRNFSIDVDGAGDGRPLSRWKKRTSEFVRAASRRAS
jgi:hypothetical protein